jgi:hypothetical protein
MYKYKIICLQGSGLDSWFELYTKKEIIEKFYEYACLEWDSVPNKKWFTFKLIEDFWEVRIEKVSLWKWIFLRKSLRFEE